MGDENMRHIVIDLSDLEWEIINQALGAPIREYLLAQLKSIGRSDNPNEIDAAWDSAIEKWSKSY